jgi:hypothetical protein
MGRIVRLGVILPIVCGCLLTAGGLLLARTYVDFSLYGAPFAFLRVKPDNFGDPTHFLYVLDWGNLALDIAFFSVLAAAAVQCLRGLVLKGKHKAMAAAGFGLLFALGSVAYLRPVASKSASHPPAYVQAGGWPAPWLNVWVKGYSLEPRRVERQYSLRPIGFLTDVAVGCSVAFLLTRLSGRRAKR